MGQELRPIQLYYMNGLYEIYTVTDYYVGLWYTPCMNVYSDSELNLAWTHSGIDGTSLSY
jgi:hypothetical protein